MSNLAPLTSRQKEILATHYMRFDEWGVERETIDYLYVVNRRTGKKKAVAKNRRRERKHGIS